MGILHDIVSCWTTLGPFQRPTGPTLASEKAPGWPNMAYNHVLCPWKLLVGHLDHLGSCRAIVWSPGALRGLMGPPRGAPRAKTGPFGVPWGPEEARYQAKVCDNHNSNPVRPIGSSWDQIWPLWCVQKLFSQLGSV